MTTETTSSSLGDGASATGGGGRARSCSWRCVGSAPCDNARERRSRATRGRRSRRAARLRSGSLRADADLPRLRLPVPVDRRRRRALVPQPRRAARRRRATRSPTSRCASGTRGERPRACRACACVAVGPRMALYGDGGQRRIAAAARVRRRRARAPAAPRPPLRRRAHRVVPVLLAARGRRCVRRARAATGWSSTGTRSGARDYWREYLGRRRRRDRRRGAARCACGSRQRAFCFSRLHARAPARARACAARSTVLEGEYAGRPERRPAPRPAEPLVVFAGRHIPEKRAPARRAGGRARARERLPGAARRDLRRRAGARGGAGARSRAHGLGGVGRRARLRRRRGGRARRCAARSAWCCRRGARATGWSSSRRPSRGTPSVVVREPGQRGGRAGRGRRQRLRGAPRAAPTDLAAAIVRVHDGRAGAARVAPRTGSRATPARLSLDASLDAVAAELRAPASARS